MPELIGGLTDGRGNPTYNGDHDEKDDDDRKIAREEKDDDDTNIAREAAWRRQLPSPVVARGHNLWQVPVSAHLKIYLSLFVVSFL